MYISFVLVLLTQATLHFTLIQANDDQEQSSCRPRPCPASDHLITPDSINPLVHLENTNFTPPNSPYTSFDVQAVYRISKDLVTGRVINRTTITTRPYQTIVLYRTAEQKR